MHVFVSYAHRDQHAVERLRADFERLGHPVWLDRPGQDWWAEVLRRIRDCSVFVPAISPDSLRSKACQVQLEYARALRRPILPVVVAEVDDPPADAVDYTNRTPETVIALLKAFTALPPTTPLPARLPAPPNVPTAHLGAYLARIEADELDAVAQADLVTALRQRLSGDEQAEVWDLLVRLRDRPGLDEGVMADLEVLLAPAWRPDPRQRYEGRYWDGQEWTTLVRLAGAEFNDRTLPPREHAHLPRPEETTDELPVAEPRHRAPRRRPALPWLVATGVLLAGGGITAGVIGIGAGRPDGASAALLARDFVTAVNIRDRATMQQYVCDRDRQRDAHLYGGLLDAANVTLESVDADGDDPRFTILAARTAGTSSVRLAIPLTEENGRWRVCDIGRALSGT